jgi:tRNA threonylcarbamoyladenosine biosynthesis protein TsaB
MSSSHELVGREHARKILPALEDLFSQASTEPATLRGIGVGVGPGSYTGLRIAIATAKGLARGLDLPVTGCDTLAAIAFGYLRDGEMGIAALDARRGNVYAGIYQKGGDEITVVEAAAKADKRALQNRYPKLSWIEDQVPYAEHIARQASTRGSLSPLYL